LPKQSLKIKSRTCPGTTFYGTKLIN